MKCPKCQIDNPDDSVYCRKCATQIRPAEAVSITKTILKPTDELPIGSTFAGKYKILGEIGRGGMGIVHKAEDLKLKRFVALKLLPAELAGDKEAKERFVREAQAAAALSHPNICTIYEVEEADEKTFIAMEYIEGHSIREKIVKAPLNTEEALEIGIQAAQGLAEAHKKGITHRDIKSANIMIDENGQIKIMDFGLAKVAGGALITKEARPMGTVAYMSPEQARGESVDHRTDIWALGVVLYEMFCSRLPFPGENEASVLYNIEHKDPLPIRKFKNDIPAELEKIIYRSLKKKLESRYQSANEVLSDLREYQDFLKAPEYGITDLKSFIRFVKRPKIAIPAIVAILIIGFLAVWFFHRQAKIRWAKHVAIPEIERLADADDRVSALRLAKQVESILPEDPELHLLFQIISLRYNIETIPSGAEVYFKDYKAPDDDWELLGISPIESVRIPGVFLHLMFVKDGFVTVERVRASVFRSLRLKLNPEETSPSGMVHVLGGSYQLGNLDPVKLEHYWLDKYEVTNKEYKQFVDAGGYNKREYWKQPILKAGKPISWEEAISEFQDRTGRPGPSTWELGTYPEGQEDYPVCGVSWYEALAYAEFVGKSIPTIFHWSRASRAGAPNIFKLSNFAGEGPAKVGSYQGLSGFGNYDMAGNVKEWCWNEAQGKRYILGGSWEEPHYMFTSSDCRDPMDRSPTNGFRCALFEDALSEVLIGAVDRVEDYVYDHGKEKPVNDDIYQVYKSFYSYDRTDLNAEVESVDTSSPHWRKEKITFDAAYGNERVIAYLFLPEGTAPPYQTVVYFPGGEGIFLKSSDDIPMSLFDFIIRSGRALIYPVYKGIYQRGPFKWMSEPSAFRDQFIQQYKDLARSIDYLETREDIDREKLAYCGFSVGGTLGPIFTALEERFKVSVFISGGFMRLPVPEVHSLHFAPRSRIPILMINGRDDFGYPLETSQIPMFRLMGAPEKDKRHVILEGGHVVPRLEMIKETLDWLDHYLGPVK
jgi:hypothetical protein